MQRVLIIIMRHHGDVLLTTPVIQALQRHCPGSEVDVLVYSYAAELLEHHAGVSNIHVVDRAWKKAGLAALLRAEWQLLRRLRRRRFDTVLALTDQWRCAMLAWLLQPKQSLALSYPKRQGSLLWRRSFKEDYAAVPHRHMIDLHLDSLRRLGLVLDEHDRKVGLVVPEPARQGVRKRLEALGVGEHPFILVHPASRGRHKCWQSEKYAEVINRLLANGWRVLLSGAPDAQEQALLDSIVAQCPQAPHNLCGELSLLELAALIERASVLLCVDSVPMHMAAALDTPLVALFGPTEERQWGPASSRARVLASARDCRPCLRQGCGGSGFSECLADLAADEVVLALNAATSVKFT